MMRFFLFVAFLFVLASINMLWNPSDNDWVFLGIFVFVWLLFGMLTIRVEQIKIKAKAVEVSGGLKKKKYVLKLEDNRKLFSSVKLWNKFKVGGTYSVKTWHLMFFGRGYNILSATEVKTNKKRVVKKSK